MRKIPALALAIAMALAPVDARAADRSHRDVLGVWCGSVSTYTITRSELIVTMYADNSRRTFGIESFEFTDRVVTVNWRAGDGSVVWTKFSEFSADGRHMVQLSNEAGPRRDFRRC